MNSKYSRDAEKLRGWKSAIHVERAPQPKKKGDSGTGDTSGGTPKP